MSRVVYLDSSALVKLVVREQESDVLRRHLIGRSGVTSALARTEVVRAVLDAGDSALAAARTVLRAVEIVRLDDSVLDAAAILRPAVVRSLDAIHLATARLLGDDLTELVTYDRRMGEAALGMGIRVIAPR